jgi:glyoxylase-like metal-dependent hydrolase (beta-lactamase superfamily II)
MAEGVGVEIAPKVHQITLGSGEAGGPPSTHIYYVQGRDRGAFIDAAFLEEAETRPLLEYWRGELGSPPTGWVLITHRHGEHAGGARLLKEATGARIAVGRGDVEAVNADFGGGSPVVDDQFDGGERFGLGERRAGRDSGTQTPLCSRPFAPRTPLRVRSARMGGSGTQTAIGSPRGVRAARPAVPDTASR